MQTKENQIYFKIFQNRVKILDFISQLQPQLASDQRTDSLNKAKKK